MKIGVFDSGLGGLIVTSHLAQNTDYDYVYLGDTARVPYGNRSPEIVYEYTRQAVQWLFEQGCLLVVLACNTASADALSVLQQEWLPQHYPDRRLLGVLIPTAEAAADASDTGRIGVLATAGTVASKAYEIEIKKHRPDAGITANAAPLLVPLIENQGLRFVDDALQEYLEPLLTANVDTIVLGCTHYGYIKSQVQKRAPGVTVVASEEAVPQKLGRYLDQHVEIRDQLTRQSASQYFLTDLAPNYERVGAELSGSPVTFSKVRL